MKRSLPLATLAAVAALFTALPCAALTGSGHPATEERAVAGFTGIALALPGAVELVQGDAEGATVTADDNVLPHIESVVEGGVLRLRFDKTAFWIRNTHIRIVVRARRVESIAVAGSGDVQAKTLEAQRLRVSIAGSGNVKLPALDARELRAHIAGSGDLLAAGHADALEAHLAGSGRLQASKLETRTASLRVAGSGDATAWVRESLKASIAGSGDVRYYGDPAIDKHVAGSGSLKRVGATPS